MPLQDRTPFKLLIVMPAFDEEAIIKSTIDNLLELTFQEPITAEILVVDDGSSDSTAEIAKSCGVRVISHPFNCGVGIALRTGFAWAESHNFDAVVQVDADGQHPAEEIESLIKVLKTRSADIVLGSRFQIGSWDTTLLRRVAMAILAKLVSLGNSEKITDATSGFRVSGRDAIKIFAREYPGEYLGDTVESLVLANSRGLKIVEVPANLRARQGGEASHLSFRSSLHVIRVVVMVILRLSRPKNTQAI